MKFDTEDQSLEKWFLGNVMCFKLMVSPNFKFGIGGGEFNLSFFPNKKKVKIILEEGGGVKKNYGLFSLFVTYFVWLPLLQGDHKRL